MALNDYHDTATSAALPSLYDRDKAAAGLAYTWQAQADLYGRVWPYFTGAIFDTEGTLTAAGKFVPAFPLRINQVRRACVAHAQHLWGLTGDSPHVRVTAIPKTASSDSRQKAARERANTVAVALTNFFNSGEIPAALREAGRLFMVHGGIAWELVLDPDSRYGLNLVIQDPSTFFPVPHPLNYKQLLRCHVVTRIDAELARELYGYKGKANGGWTVEYIESWSAEGWEVTVGTGPGDRATAIGPDGALLRGPNNFRDPATGRARLPIVYIPRLRTGAFYGLSLAEELIGMQDEFNARMADYGDGVRDASQMHVWGADLSRSPRKGSLKVPRGPEILDLGDTGSTGKTPQIGTLPGPNVSESTAKYADKVEAVLYDQAAISPVMRGIDEGSQRSGATLAARAIPTTSMVDDYRTAWGAGLAALGELVLLAAYNYLGGVLGDTKITRAELGHALSIGFAPVLPRDIEATNQTIQVQRGAKTMSVERALELSPDVTDPAAELERIREEQDELREKQMAQMQVRAETMKEFDGHKQEKQSDKKIE